MMKLYATWIDRETLTPPTGLAFLFIGDRFLTKTTFVRPARAEDGSTDFFRVGLYAVVPEGDELAAYIHGKRHAFFQVDSEEGLHTFGHGSLQIGFMELRQDMLAYGFKPWDFPEIARYLED